MIFTSYFGKLRELPENIFPIAISAIVPPGLKDIARYPRLTPNYDILMQYKIDHNEARYTECYKKAVLDDLDVDQVLLELDRMIPIHMRHCLRSVLHNLEDDPNCHVALICYEKSADFCHRHLVADWFKRNGIECKEWEEKE